MPMHSQLDSFWHELDSLVHSHMTRFASSQPQKTTSASESLVSVKYTFDEFSNIEFLVTCGADNTYRVVMWMNSFNQRLKMVFAGKPMGDELRCCDLKWIKPFKKEMNDYYSGYPEDRFTQMVSKMMRIAALCCATWAFCIANHYEMQSSPEYCSAHEDCFQVFVSPRSDRYWNAKLRLYFAQDPDTDKDSLCRILFTERFHFAVTAHPVAFDQPIHIANADAFIQFLRLSLKKPLCLVSVCEALATKTVSWSQVCLNFKLIDIVKSSSNPDAERMRLGKDYKDLPALKLVAASAAEHND